jgi:hypothetical protein
VLGFLRFIPFRAEFLYDQYGVEAMGLSPLFRDVPEGEITPSYRLTMRHDDAGKVDGVSVVEE